MLFDLSALVPFAIGFFLVALVATSLAVVALASLAVERHRPAHPVAAISAAHPTDAKYDPRAA